MNSLLQCLFNIKELRDFFIFGLINGDFDEKTQPINYSFAKVMYDLLYLDADYITPNDFKNEISKINKLFVSNKAADATDLFRNLIDSFLTQSSTGDEEEYLNEISPNNKKSLLKAIEKEKSSNIFYKYINVYTLTSYLCPFHKNEFEFEYSYESDSNITFFLDNIIKYKKDKNSEITLKECFEYIQREKKNNHFFCSKCKKTVVGKSFETIVSPPEILIIILNRGKGKKVTNEVIIDTILNISDFIDIEENSDDIYYKLIGSCNHSGDSSPTGHYTATCLYEESYYHFNDSNFIKLKSFKYLGEPYILFYRLININDHYKLSEIKNEIIPYNCNNIEVNPLEKNNYGQILSDVFSQIIRNNDHFKINLVEKNNLFKYKIIKGKSKPLIMDFSVPPKYNLLSITYIDTSDNSLGNYIDGNGIRNINIDLNNTNKKNIYDAIVFFLNKAFEEYIVVDSKCPMCNIF